MGRVVSQAELPALRDELRAAGKRIVLTNGYFDLLHIGHLRYLQDARALGDVLIVGVNTDSTATRSKGPLRPVIPQDERAELVAGLACVDYAMLFSDDTAIGLVDVLQPQIYVKGGDYGEGRTPLPEADAVRNHGGEVVILPLVADHSTTSLIERIVRLHQATDQP